MIYRRLYLLVLLFSVVLSSCEKENESDTYPPTVMSTTPENGATSVDTSSLIIVRFTEKVNLKDGAGISLNGLSVNAYAEHKSIVIDAALNPGSDYSLKIPEDVVYDEAGNYAKEVILNFSTAEAVSVDENIYEAENCVLTGGASVANTLSGFSGSGYVSSGDGNLEFAVTVDRDGFYDLSVRYSNNNSKKSNDLYVDGQKIASMTFSATTDWKILEAGKIRMKSGSHKISIIKSWGWTNYDYIKLQFIQYETNQFDISPKPVTQNASAEAVKLYEFLKQNFGLKIISGTMAAHSTNIQEAIWVHDNTGKWPALTCFDFIDHTLANQDWVKYNNPYILGKEWWQNNGIVALMWHWRDPLTKSGSFYTDKTTFDLSKISDTTSNEYKEIIEDIDVIASYLKVFRDDKIPVLWRPLHEASGGWFWWGAKGAENCKKLWKLMFDRFTKVHNLNNLIWIWTTDIDDSAINWYPGDEYVDVIGMDIYPGNNQHGSQYFSFFKVKEIFGGKKIITLSECGSAPDPGLMKEYGDMWSWFMPWNGEMTESATHNGIEWWNKFFSYDFVITRDKMPSLK